MMGQHRWSGWPGAYCLLCGAEDALENAVGMGWYDPLPDKWDSEDHKQQVLATRNNCPATKDGEDPYKVEPEKGRKDG